jgi:glyoxylase-like metal-dependent hydrolase (beta-lactamase superfamily II)
MRITNHGDYLVQLTRFQRVFQVNCYLVSKDDGLTLIDTGIPGNAPAILAAGDRIGSLQVSATPGHTPGHIALFDARDGTLIAGDAFQTRAGIAVSGTVRWLFPFPAMATWNRPTALVSARGLRALAPTRLAVGHGDVLEQPNEAIDRAIATTTRELGEAPAHGT